MCFTVSTTNRLFSTISLFKHVSLYSKCKDVTKLAVQGWASGCLKVAAQFLAYRCSEHCRKASHLSGPIKNLNRCFHEMDQKNSDLCFKMTFCGTSKSVFWL